MASRDDDVWMTGLTRLAPLVVVVSASLAAACTPTAAPAAALLDGNVVSSPEPSAPSAASSQTGRPPVAVVPATPSASTTGRSNGDGRCEPLPREGTPCEKGDGYCVESWGHPGGWSSALWCRGGRWVREEEQNLP